MSDHDVGDGTRDEQLGADAEAQMRTVLDERAALADDAVVPDFDELIRARSSPSRRRLTVVVAAVAACAVLVVGAAAVISGHTSDEVGGVAASPYELLAELKGADSSQSFAFELERSTTQTGGGGCSSTTNQRGRSNSEGTEWFVRAGLLSQDEADAIVRSASVPDARGVAADDDQRVDAWIDDVGQVRRLAITTNLRAPDSTPTQSSTTYTTTVEAFDYGQGHLAVPDTGVTHLGALPADVLRPVDPVDSECGQAPVERMRDCTASAFNDAAAGRTVDEFVATIPKTFKALISPNGWFETCPNGIDRFHLPPMLTWPSSSRSPSSTRLGSRHSCPSPTRSPNWQTCHGRPASSKRSPPPAPRSS